MAYDSRESGHEARLVTGTQIPLLEHNPQYFTVVSNEIIPIGLA